MHEVVEVVTHELSIPPNVGLKISRDPKTLLKKMNYKVCLIFFL